MKILLEQIVGGVQICTNNVVPEDSSSNIEESITNKGIYDKMTYYI